MEWPHTVPVPELYQFRRISTNLTDTSFFNDVFVFIVSDSEGALYCADV